MSDLRIDVLHHEIKYNSRSPENKNIRYVLLYWSYLQCEIILVRA